MTMTLAERTTGAEIMERVVIEGDLGKLKPEERVIYYQRVCESLNINPLTRPFDYITLNGKLTLYAKKDCTDQLRANRGVSITQLERQRLDELYVVTAYAKDKEGRVDSALGVVNVKGLTGEALANALMKAETKAKRRVTLSLCGLGWTDESEVGSIPNAQTIVVDQETGEVIEEPGDDRRQKALDQWAEITQEADQLNIIHKDLPVNAPADQIERWALALEKKVREAEEF
jgi:uncharacterized metal-binding protein